MTSHMLSNFKVYDLDESVVASGYPMKTIIPKVNCLEDGDIIATDADCMRASLLANYESTEGHDNFLAGIIVSFDLTCSIKMWTEFERYHFAQIVSSQSTMHRLTKMTIDDVCLEYVDPQIKERLKILQERANETNANEDILRLLYSCPTGLKLTARVTTNYRQLKTMYKQRKNHRLPEWRQFCYELDLYLPFSNWVTGKKEN